MLGSMTAITEPGLMPEARLTDELIASMRARAGTDLFANRYVNQAGELVAEIDWDVVNFERATARGKGDKESQAADQLTIPHPWAEDELDKLRAQVLSEQPRGGEPRYWDDVAPG